MSPLAVKLRCVFQIPTIERNRSAKKNGTTLTCVVPLQILSPMCFNHCDAAQSAGGLAIDADVEAEDAPFVDIFLQHGEAEVKRQRNRAHLRNSQP